MVLPRAIALASVLAALSAGAAAASEKLVLNLGGAALLAPRGETAGSGHAPPAASLLAWPRAAAVAMEWPAPSAAGEEESAYLLALGYPLSPDGLWQSYLGAGLAALPLRGVVEGERASALQFAAGIGYRSEGGLLLYGGWRYLEPEPGRVSDEREPAAAIARIEGGFRLQF